MKFSIWTRLQQRVLNKVHLTTHPYADEMQSEIRLRIPLAWGDKINESNVQRVEEAIDRCATELKDILG